MWPVMVLGVVVAAAVTLAVGAVSVPVGEVAAVLAAKVGIGEGGPERAEAVVWGIRMPRLLLGFVVGASLAVVGVVLQGLLRNDMADPHLLGIGPGAAIGAAIGSAAGGVRGAIAGGVLAGVVTAFVVRRLSRRESIDRTRIILAGVALGAILSAWVGFVVFAADRTAVPPIEFWLLGSLSGSTWTSLGTTAVILVVATLGLFTAARTLDLFSLGEHEARHLGIDTDLVGTVLLIACGAAVGATVGAVGVIAFVGLLIPFLIRPVAGHAHQHLLPAAVIGGGLFVVLADLVARVALDPVEVPVGLVTAAIGGPAFLWLLSRRRDA